MMILNKNLFLKYVQWLWQCLCGRSPIITRDLEKQYRSFRDVKRYIYLGFFPSAENGNKYLVHNLHNVTVLYMCSIFFCTSDSIELTSWPVCFLFIIGLYMQHWKAWILDLSIFFSKLLILLANGTCGYILHLCITLLQRLLRVYLIY